MVREADSRERMLLDPISPAAGQMGQAHANITQFAPSPNGKLVALNVDRGGSETTTITVPDVDSGKALLNAVEHICGEFAASWQTNSAGVAIPGWQPPRKGSTPC